MFLTNTNWSNTIINFKKIPLLIDKNQTVIWNNYHCIMNKVSCVQVTNSAVFGTGIEYREIIVGWE